MDGINYVKTGNMVIEVGEKDTDSLFGYLWEFASIEKDGADTDFENNFGEITHEFYDNQLVRVNKL
jgi:hypothetical protein